MAQILKERGRAVPLLIILDGIINNTGAELSAWNPLYHWKLIHNLPLWISDNIAEGWGFRGVFKRVQREMKLTLSSLLTLKRKAPGATVDAFMDTSILPPKQADFTRALYHALELYQPTPYDGEIFWSIRRGRSPCCIFCRWTGPGKKSPPKSRRSMSTAPI